MIALTTLNHSIFNNSLLVLLFENICLDHSVLVKTLYFVFV
jgi:hypothetical protein